ncbi:MAG: hypothetical protein U1G07_16475 [Verrucomicrobiota bacterium]
MRLVAQVDAGDALDFVDFGRYAVLAWPTTPARSSHVRPGKTPPLPARFRY